jgi:hypothetical protein
MADWIRNHGRDLAMRHAQASDRAALADYVRRRKVCDATGERLAAAAAVAMTVTVAPGVSKFAVVTAAHWDGGQGALSSADPNVDPDVLDGRLLFSHDTRPRSDPDARVAPAHLAQAGRRSSRIRRRAAGQGRGCRNGL